MSVSEPWDRPRRLPLSARLRERLARSGAFARSLFGGGGEEVDWVTVYTAMAMEEAHVVAGSLRAADIPATIRADGQAFMGSAAAFRGIEVRVPEPLVDAALAVLDEADEADEAEADEDEVAGDLS